MRGTRSWLMLGMMPLALGAFAQAKPSAEVKAIEHTFSTESAACQEHFAVTACVDDARKRRREALAVVQQREHVQQQAQRQRAAAERGTKIDNKQRAASQRAAGPPAAATSSPSGPPAVSGSKSYPSPHVPRQKGSTPDAASRKQAHADREQAALAHRQEFEKRNTERAAKRARAAPLPVPDAASR